jgi:multidrug efflux system outer membrane protein
VTLLESQRRAVNSESARLQIARQRLDNRVNLYLALGGPFDNTLPPNPSTALNRS